MTKHRVRNEEIAETLERIGELLEVQQANPHRVRAYRRAASTVRNYDASIADRVSAGPDDDLESLPGVGRSLAAVIREIVATGRAKLLERLEGETSPVDLFTTIPGIGPGLAERIEQELDIETLEELEAAAHDGRLESIAGFGARRVRAAQESLGHLLRLSATQRARAARSGHAPPTDEDDHRPQVSSLLAFDRRYREEAEKGSLRLIAPRRFNPQRRAWLPVLHEDLDDWSMTALFSNTARAHELGRTKDWVIIYYESDGREGRSTVVTEHTGALRGKRVVRGRERKCAHYYAACAAPPRGSGAAGRGARPTASATA